MADSSETDAGDKPRLQPLKSEPRVARTRRAATKKKKRNQSVCMSSTKFMGYIISRDIEEAVQY